MFYYKLFYFNKLNIICQPSLIFYYSYPQDPSLHNTAFRQAAMGEKKFMQGRGHQRLLSNQCSVSTQTQYDLLKLGAGQTFQHNHSLCTHIYFLFNLQHKTIFGPTHYHPDWFSCIYFFIIVCFIYNILIVIFNVLHICGLTTYLQFV